MICWLNLEIQLELYGIIDNTMYDMWRKYFLCLYIRQITYITKLTEILDFGRSHKDITYQKFIN